MNGLVDWEVGEWIGGLGGRWMDWWIGRQVNGLVDREVGEWIGGLGGRWVGG